MFNFEELFKDIFNENSYELESIKLTYQLISGTIPSTPAELKNQMVQLDQIRIEMSTLYYMLSREITKLKTKCQKETDSSYVRLVKLGRPSKDAIETELRASNEIYAVNSLKIESYSHVKELVMSYIKTIDARKQTVVELLRNAYRVD